jgi:hypothetical protein
MTMERCDLSPAEKLEANLSVALERQAEVMAMGVDPDNLKATRLVAEVASSTVNASLKAQENALHKKKDDDVLARIIEIIREEKAKLEAGPDYVPPITTPKKEADRVAEAVAELPEADRAEVIAEIERQHN